MKFIKPTLNYMTKNALYLGLMGLVPAIFLGTLISPFRFIEFANTYSTTPLLNFGTIFTNLMDFGFIELLILLTALILLAIFIGGMLGQIEHHFRSGKRNLLLFKDHVNNNVLIVLANLFAAFVFILLLSITTSAILFFLHLIISGIYISPTVFNIVLAIIFISVALVILCLVISVLLINTANMLFDGSRFKSSLGTAIRLLQKNMFAMLLAVIVPILVISVFVSLTFMGQAGTVINVLSVWFLTMYYPSLMMVAYYDITSTVRYDKRKKYYSK